VRDTGQEPHAIVSEVFLFEYGVTVIWGMTEDEEKRFLNEIKKFEVESLRASNQFLLTGLIVSRGESRR